MRELDDLVELPKTHRLHMYGADFIEVYDEEQLRTYGQACYEAGKQSAARERVDLEAEVMQVLRIVRKVALFNGGPIADDLGKVERFIHDISESVNRIYAAIPTLPITAESASQATDAFIDFCHAFNLMIGSQKSGEGEL